MTTGFFSVQGTQKGTAAGNQQTLGPYNVPFGSVSDVTESILAPGTTAFPVPGGSNGVAIIPPIGSPPGGVVMKMKTVLGDSGTPISTQQPTLLEWDIVNVGQVPANLYLVVSGGGIIVVVQFT